MGYVDQNLITDEHVTYRGRLHWGVLVVPILLDLVFTAVAVACFYQAAVVEGENTPWLVGGVAALVLGSLPLLVAMVKRASAEFAVTNKRVIVKSGVVRRRTLEMFLVKIESIDVEQSVPGRMFGYGTIVLRGTGGSSEPFTTIAQPLEFRRQVQEQIAKLTDPTLARTNT